MKSVCFDCCIVVLIQIDYCHFNTQNIDLSVVVKAVVVIFLMSDKNTNAV